MIDDEKLMAAWFSCTATNALAAELRLKPKQLYYEWRRLKDEGRLPFGDRPRNLQAQSADTVKTTASDFDGRPSVGWYEDPLLEKLNQEHPERKRRG